MMKLTSIILAVLLGSVGAARGQQRSGETLSDADKTDLSAALLSASEKGDLDKVTTLLNAGASLALL